MAFACVFGLSRQFASVELHRRQLIAVAVGVVQATHQTVSKPQEIHTFFVYRDGTTTAAGVNCLHFDTD